MKQLYKNGLMSLMSMAAVSAAFAFAPAANQANSIKKAVDANAMQCGFQNIEVNGTNLQIPSYWQEMPQDKVMHIKGAKPSQYAPKSFVAFNKGKLQNAKKAATRAEGDDAGPLTVVYVTIDTEGFEYQQYVYNMACNIFSRDGEVSEYAVAGDEDWDFDSPLESSVPARNDYVVLVKLDLEVPNYKDDGVQYGGMIISYVKDVKISGESMDVTVKLSDATINYDFSPVDHEGKPFPVTNPASEDMNRPSTSAYSFPGFSFFNVADFGLMNYGNLAYFFQAPPLEQDCYFYGSSTLMYANDPIIEVMSGAIPGPVKQDVVLTNNPDDYKEYSAKFQMTPRDRIGQTRGTGYVQTSLYYDPLEEMPFSSWGGALNGAIGVPFNTAIFYDGQKSINPNAIETVYAPETRAFYSMEEFYSENKVAGAYLNSDGKQVIVNTNIFTNTYGSYTFKAPVPQFNIDPQEQDVLNFYNALFGSAYLELEIYPEYPDQLAWMGAIFTPTGPFNETIGLDYAWSYADQVKYNGQEADINDIYTYPIQDAEYEATFIYDNVYVEGTLPCEVAVTVGANTRTDDKRSPQMTNFQVRDEDGKVCTRIPTDQKGTLYVGVQDNSLKLASIEISVAPEGSNDFKPLTADYVESKEFRGGYAIADLSGLSHDTFYTVKVLAKDYSDNFTENTIPYAFNITDQGAGVKGIQTTGNGAAEYYNLQGLRISNPEAGQIYIVRRGNEVYKELYK